MRDSNEIVRDRQLAIRRELNRRGILMKQVELDSGMSSSTLLSYFPANSDAKPAVIPMSAIYTLMETRAIPDDLLDLLLPAGVLFVRVPDGIDHDEMETRCREYLSAKGKAHQVDSPAGREISDCEENVLDMHAARIGALAA